MSKRASPKGDVVGARRIFTVFSRRRGKIIRHSRGTRSMQATSVFVCIHGACVHSGNCARGTTSTRARIPANIDPVVALQWKFNFPHHHRNFCFLRNPLLSSHYSWERLKGYGLSCGLRRFSMMIILFLFCLEGVWTRI